LKIHIIIETDEKGGIHINTETTPTKPAPPPLNIPFDGFYHPLQSGNSRIQHGTLILESVFIISKAKSSTGYSSLWQKRKQTCGNAGKRFGIMRVFQSGV